MILVQIILQKHKSQIQQGVFVCPRACLSVCLCLCLCMYVCMYARTCSVCARVCVCASEWRRVRAIITILFHAYSSSTVFLTNNTNLVPRTMLVKIILFREHRLSCKKKNHVPRTLLVMIILFRVRSSSTVFRIAHAPENNEGAFIMKILLVLSGNLDCPTLKSD